MTLNELIQIRGVDKPAYHKQGFTEKAQWAKGFWSGWAAAYNDLREILEQNGFNLDMQITNEQGISNKIETQQSLSGLIEIDVGDKE